MKMKIEIVTNNAAFEPNETFTQIEGYELARILRKLASKVEHETISVKDDFVVMDINGHKVLTAIVVDED